MKSRGFGRPGPSSRSAAGNGFGGAAAARSSLSFFTPSPDLSKINDPNLVVSFKSLLKKSDATLFKALDEIRQYVKAQENGIEEPVIKAWSELYPRTTIKNSRRVRELAHLVQWAILEAAQSKIQPFLAQMVPTWLAGKFDNDKGVAKAAAMGWDSLLNINEKMSALLKIFQPAILAYAQEGLDETPETLSDERTMSADDLKATYFRLVSNCIDMVAHLMNSLSELDRQKYIEKYEAFFGNSDFLECTSSEDMHLRRSSIRLISACVFKQTSAIKSNLKAISHTLISEALSSTQLGSAFDLLELIKILTMRFPQLWTEVASKKNPLARLRSFVEKGSQRGEPDFWSCLASLLAIMPDDVLPHKLNTILDVLSSIRVGINNRDEPRTNRQMAWITYVDITFDMATKRLSDPDAQVKLVEQAILPAITTFILITPREVGWSVDAPARIRQVLELMSSLESGAFRDRVRDLVLQDLTLCANKLEEDMFSSLADDIVKLRFVHWFLIVDWVFTDTELRTYLGCTKPEDNAILSITEKLILACPKVIDGRQGKPYGAASVMSTCMLCAAFIKERPAVVGFMEAYLEQQLFGLLLTPSGEYLLSALGALKTLGRQETFNKIWSTTIRKVMELNPGDRQNTLIILMLSKSGGNTLAVTNKPLQDFILHHSRELLQHDFRDDDPSWSVLCVAAASQSFSDAVANEVTDVTILNLLSGDDAAIDRGLKALKCFSEKYLAVLVSSADRRRELLTRLLMLNEDESDDPGRKLAIETLTRIISGGGNSNTNVNLINVLRNQLLHICKPALSVHALANLARNILATGSEVMIHDLYPTKQELEQLGTIYSNKPPAYLGACEPFGSALFLISSHSEPDENVRFHERVDNGGHSIPLRAALYMCELMQSTMLSLDAERAAEVLFFLCITQQVLRSQRMTGNLREMYSITCGHVEIFDAQLYALLVEVVGKSTDFRRNSEEEVLANDTRSILDALLKTLLEQSHGTTPLSFYSGLALSNVLSTLVLIRGPNFQCTEGRLEDMGFSTTELNKPFTSLAILSGFGQAIQSSDLVKRLCKTLGGLIHKIDSGPLSNNSIDKALQTLCLLNGCSGVYGEDENPMPTAVMAQVVRKVISWIDGQDFSGQNLAVASEACRILTKMLPALKHITGSFWSEILAKLCLSPWILYGPNKSSGNSLKTPSESKLFVLCAWSVKMYSRMASLKDIEDEEAFAVKDAFNEDQMQANLNRCLLGLLKHPREDTPAFTPYDRPVFANLHESLRPEINKIPIEEIVLGEIYPLMDSYVLATQAISFETVHRALPKLIDDMTLNVVVGDQDAELPAELLSLLYNRALEHQSLFKDSDVPISSIPHAHRSALLVWNLVIQCFALAPHQVKVGFQKSLQQMDVLKRFLQFVHHTFSAQDGKMKLFLLDHDSIRKYDVYDLSGPAGLVHSVRWLAAHNYFLALKHMPQMVKSWYLDFTRAGKSALEDWTEKNFTPLVLEDCIKEIRDWRGPNEVKDVDDGNSFLVRLPSRNGSTLTLSYEIDDQFCTVQFVFPASYPLMSIEVKPITRVALTERAWISVIKHIAGAMRFNCGSVIDGIEVFQRNVSGALAGHENCYICYSVIGENMKVPDKTCSTCKKVYHSSCLAQWFKSSNGNTCPTCRQPFTGLARR